MPGQEWANSKFDCLYFDCEAETGLECKVIVGDGEVEVSYVEDGDRYYYRGLEVAPGHFTLRAVGFDGEATLHQFPDGRILEGYWTEEGNRGMWKIQLA